MTHWSRGAAHARANEEACMNDAAAERANAQPSGDGPVAVIVVHGVADQPRGQTAEAVATQLALQTDRMVTRRDVTLHVEPCKPAVCYQRWEAEGLWAAMQKSFFHSLRSDFLDPRLGGADSEIARRRHKQPAEKPAQPLKALPNSAAADNDIPLGVRFTDFLIAKNREAHVAKAHAPHLTTARAQGSGQERAQPVAAGSEDGVVHTVARFDIGADSARGTPQLS